VLSIVQQHMLCRRKAPQLSRLVTPAHFSSVTTALTTSVDAQQYGRTANAGSSAADALSILLTVGGRLVHAACQAVVLVFIARLGGTQETASFIWAMALTAPVFMFTNMNLLDMIATETSQGYSIRDYWDTRLLTSILGIVILLAVVPQVAPSREWAIIAAVAVAKALESLNDLILGVYHRCDRAGRAAASLIIRSVGGVLCLAAILTLTANVIVGLMGMVIFQFAVLIVYDMSYVREYGEWSNSSTLSSVCAIVRTALPLGIVACLSSLSLNVPRYAVYEQLDQEALAAFGCCASFLQAFTLIGVATQLALCPRMASRNSQSRRLMNEMLWRNVTVVACIGIVVVVCAYVWGDVALAIIYGQQYRDYGPVLTWLMIAGMFAACKGFLASGLTTTRSTRSQAAFAAVQFGIALVGCLWFVPKYGVVAAAGVVAVSSAMSFVLHAIWTLVTGREATAK
jgi:O-antigen/teichoic acid export membrane protein